MSGNDFSPQSSVKIAHPPTVSLRGCDIQNDQNGVFPREKVEEGTKVSIDPTFTSLN